MPNKTFENDLTSIIEAVSAKITLLASERDRIEAAVNANIDLPTNTPALVTATASLASAQSALASLKDSDCCTGQSCTIIWTE